MRTALEVAAEPRQSSRVVELVAVDAERPVSVPVYGSSSFLATVAFRVRRASIWSSSFASDRTMGQVRSLDT
jgi:hypothetical protein